MRKLIDMLQEGARGSLYSGFPPIDAEKLARNVAAQAPMRPVTYGKMKALVRHVRSQKYPHSRAAFKDIVNWLVKNDARRSSDFRR